MGQNQRKVISSLSDFSENLVSELYDIMINIKEPKAWALWFWLYINLKEKDIVLIDCSVLKQDLGLGEKALKSAWDLLLNTGFLFKKDTNIYCLCSIPTFLPKEKEEQWSVYKLTFPNNKIYIGISKAPETRWSKGEGYRNQSVYEAIKEFGWDNIKHDILASNLTKTKALELEKKLIEKFQTIRYGYNGIK